MTAGSLCTDLSGIGSTWRGLGQTGEQETKHFTGKGHTLRPQEEHSEGLHRATPSAVRSDSSLHVCKSVIYHFLWPVFPGRRRKKRFGRPSFFLYLKVALRTIIKCS